VRRETLLVRARPLLRLERLAVPPRLLGRTVGVRVRVRVRVKVRVKVRVRVRVIGLGLG
jgi:hypothetical protein